MSSRSSIFGWEWLIGSRQLYSRRRRGFVSFISAVSIVGLAIGVAVLILVLSVMNGFERELRSRILAVTSHAQLLGLNGTLPDWRSAQQAASRLAGVDAAVPFVEAQAVLSHGTDSSATLVRGILPAEERRAVGLAANLDAATLAALQPGAWRIVLGDALAERLGAHAGDAVVLMAPAGSATPAGIAPRMRRMVVAGTFHSGMYEYDSRLALLHIDDARRIYRLGDGVTGLRLALADPLQAPRLVRSLALQLGGGYYVSDWTRVHAAFFESIRLSKSLLFIVMLLLVAVAAFNIVAALVMVVKDKSAEIAILRTLGAAPRSVLLAFAIQGALIGLVGALAGAALGCLLSVNITTIVHGLENLLHTRFLDASVYFMSDLPAWVRPGDVLRVSGVAFLVCALATLYPALRAAQTEPATALRHERRGA
jgi:lipoprotein-releasing system permease protein